MKISIFWPPHIMEINKVPPTLLFGKMCCHPSWVPVCFFFWNSLVRRERCTVHWSTAWDNILTC